MFVGASTHIIGTSHESSGQPCQDRAASWMSEDGGVGIIVLCDGAGSCSCSEIGADLLCEWFPYWVATQANWWTLETKEIPGILIPAMREILESAAVTRSIPLQALSSTFLAAIARREGDHVAYRILHLGDGVAACIGNDGMVVISEPENGEFANETIFSTSNSAISSLRVIEGIVPFGSGFVLMSDGAAESLYLKSQRVLAPAITEMISWLNDHDSETVSQALEINGKELFTQRTGDDCSIALLLDRDPQKKFEVVINHSLLNLHYKNDQDTQPVTCE
jgi:Protein phosphatase 2C